MKRALKSAFAGAAVVVGLAIPVGSASATTHTSEGAAPATTQYCFYHPTTSARLFASPNSGGRVVFTYGSSSTFVLATPLQHVNGPGGPFIRWDGGRTGYLRIAALTRSSGPCTTPSVTDATTGR